MKASDKPVQVQQVQEVDQGGQDGQIVVEGSVHIGPLPPPNTLAEYEQIQSGFAERIVRMAEKEQKQRHLNNRTFVRTFSRGQLFGFALSIAGMGTSAFLLSQGMEIWNGLGIFLLSIVPSAISRIMQKANRLPAVPSQESIPDDKED